VGTKNL